MTQELDSREHPQNFWVRELFGVFLLFWLLLLVLSLLSYSVEDPSLNHAVHKKDIANLGGLVGAYVSGFLNDLFGTGSLVLPCILGVVAIGCLTRRQPLRWWRWIGVGLLSLSAIVFVTAVDLTIGDLRGGGMLGAVIIAASKRLFSPFGSTLIWFMIFMAGLQLFVDLPWKTMVMAVAARFIHDEPDPETKPKSAIDGPTAHRLIFPDEEATPPAPDKDEGLLDRALKPLSRGAAFLRLRRTKHRPEEGEELEAGAQPEGRRTARRRRARGVPLAEEHLPFARVEDSGVPMDTSYADEYAAPVIGPVIEPEVEEPEEGEDDILPEIKDGAVIQDSRTQPRARGKVGRLLDLLPSKITSLNEVEREAADTAVEENVADAEERSAGRRRAQELAADDVSGKVTSIVSDAVPDDLSPDHETGTAQGIVQTDLSEQQASSPHAQSPAAILFPSAEADDEESLTQASAAEETLPWNPDESVQRNGEAQDEESDTAVKAVVRTARSAVSLAGLADEDDASESSGDEETFAGLAGTHAAGTAAASAAVPVQNASRTTHADASAVSTAKEPEEDVLQPAGTEYVLPPLALLQKPEPVLEDEEEDVEERSAALMSCLADFSIQADLVRATPGPVVTTYMVRPAPGVSVRVFTRHTEDIARSLMAVSVFVQAPVPGTDTVGIVIPNRSRAVVNFREIASTDAFQKASGALPLIVGKDTTGKPYVADLARMPHLLVAGATGQGKSVCLNAMLTSLLLTRTPDELKLLLVDPKRVEMGMYEEESHLVHPVVKEVSDAKNALLWAVHEMDQRYNRMARLYTKNITGYNAKLASYKGRLPAELADLEPMPYIVIVIDELADLMLQARKDVEPCIIRLAQLARACGIHMIIATQRPSVDVVTGLIKANFPCRICFRVSSRQDSITTLGNSGAEKLLGNGDMFYNPNGGHLTRLHGPYLRDEEVQSVVEFWKKQCRPDYQVDFSTWNNDEEEEGAGSGRGHMVDTHDAMYQEVLDFISEKGFVSISLLQRRFNIGYNKAARYMDQLDADGLVGPSPGAGKPRPVLMR